MVQCLASAFLPSGIGGDGSVMLGSALLPHAHVVQSHSRVEARDSVTRIFFSHNLGASRDSRDVDFTLRSCYLGGTSFNFIRYGIDIDVSAGAGEADKYIFVAPLSGDCTVRYLGRSNYVVPGGFVILKPLAPFDFSMSKDHAHIAVGISQAAMAAAMVGRFGGLVDPRRLVLSGGADGPVGPVGDTMIVNFLSFVCQQLNGVGFASLQNPFSKILEQTFVSFLLEFMIGAEIDARNAVFADRAPRHVRLAEQFMRANIEEEISADEIVEASGAPMRTLYYSFKKYRGMSPLSWMKAERLKAARNALLTGSGHRTVTEIANLYCSSNLGRFSREYYRQFGEYPSQTLQRKANG